MACPAVFLYIKIMFLVTLLKVGIHNSSSVLVTLLYFLYLKSSHAFILATSKLSKTKCSKISLKSYIIEA